MAAQRDEEATNPAADLNRPVCRHCGSDDGLRSVERAITWRFVDFVYDAEQGRWTNGNEWGDEDNDNGSETVGVACANCNAEVTAPNLDPAADFDPAEIITTAAAFARLPRRAFLVDVRWNIYDHATVPVPHRREDRTYVGHGITAYLAGVEIVDRLGGGYPRREPDRRMWRPTITATETAYPYYHGGRAVR